MTDRGPRYTREQAIVAVGESRSWTEALRRLGMCASGGANVVLRKYVALWGIPTDHFDAHAHQRGRPNPRRRPLDEILVTGSSYNRTNLKQRLYRDGLKQRRCELCGQGEVWRGADMSLILDHVNGVSNDNRLENLRIVCPNCAATLDTHCGKQQRIVREPMTCPGCQTTFVPAVKRQKYCTRECAHGRDRVGVRRVARPPYAQLVREVSTLGWEQTGRRYGVSGNAIRKWVRWYEREMERRAA